MQEQGGRPAPVAYAVGDGSLPTATCADDGCSTGAATAKPGSTIADGDDVVVAANALLLLSRLTLRPRQAPP